MKPEVGMPATIGIGSDSYPAVVIKVTPKTVTIQHVEVGKNRRQWPDQDFEVFLDRPTGKIERFWMNKYGQYANGSCRLFVGRASFYQDPSF